MISFFIIFVFLNQVFGKINSKHPSLCISTQKALNLNRECTEYKTLLEKIQCISAFNSLEKLKDSNDEFNIIKLFQKTIVVYILDGKIYTTKCDEVENVEFPKYFDNCTRDLPITYTKNGIKSIGFINKHGIVREKSVSTNCNNEIEVYNVQEKQLAKYQNMVTEIDQEQTETTELDFLEDSPDNLEFSLLDFMINSSSRLESILLLSFFLFVCYFWNYFFKKTDKQKILNDLRKSKSLIDISKLKEFKNRPAQNPVQPLPNGLEALIAAATAVGSNSCRVCGKLCGNKGGLASHEKKCIKDLKDANKKRCFGVF